MDGWGIYNNSMNGTMRDEETFFTFDLHLLRITSSSIIINNPLVSCCFPFCRISSTLLLCGIWKFMRKHRRRELRRDLVDSNSLPIEIYISSNDLCSHASTEIRNDYNLHELACCVHKSMNLVLQVRILVDLQTHFTCFSAIQFNFNFASDRKALWSD